jgi:hypothetical protein
MSKPNSKDYYFWSVIIGVVAGMITRDWPVGILTTIALMLTFAARAKKTEQ